MLCIFMHCTIWICNIAVLLYPRTTLKFCVNNITFPIDKYFLIVYNQTDMSDYVGYPEPYSGDYYEYTIMSSLYWTRGGNYGIHFFKETAYTC